MAKARQWIKVYHNADKALYQIAYITGGFTKQEAKDLGVNEERLKKHIRQKNIIIERDYKPAKSKQSEYIYNLTKQGKAKTKEITNVNNIYKRSSERHDAALRKELIQAHRTKNIVQYISEKDWSYRFDEYVVGLRCSLNEHDRNEASRLEQLRAEGKISPPDAGYITSDGQMYAVEIITRFYKPEERQAKEAFIKALNIQNYTEIDIH